MADLYSVFSALISGKQIPSQKFIHDPERDALEEQVKNDFEKSLSESRKAYAKKQKKLKMRE
jgi:hypothetical protein